MKKFLLVATAAMLATAPAHAAQDSFDISATVAKTCTMDNINDINLGTLDINTAAGPNALVLTELLAAESAGEFWLSCNDSNKMTVTSANNGRLKNQTRSVSATDDPGFTDQLVYELNAQNYRDGFFATQPGFAGGISFGQGTPRAAIHRKINMRARTSALANFGARPLAGAYQDTVTVAVTTI
ncbi:spore coat protein U domain-containing protein [Sphingomonas cavernae]|uniref:Spore coat protein U/FanG domain-containing protein n=1 Tax=Sphingomonas cavernae TaxID=2320861 RepID=A0A418WQ52_9SPHN|nr:spore coat protein U domain-containing protein [Sphingomonas cavernae]RJF93375.1 hypothetical protein D3876_03265 [Sphingomonas cavernae]